MNTVMTFPDTVEEFMEQYKMTDTEHIYSNGIEYVPIFRMKQWFDNVKCRNKTNADRIRATTDEELAELFYSYGICPPEWRREPCKFSTCRECILCWLKEEAKV